MKTVDLSAGRVDYEDTGDGPVLVFLHGLLMDFEPVDRDDQRPGR